MNLANLESIRVVLCETSHPGNIGAAARAMKNMGLGSLVLVNPREFPSKVALERAANASDVVENARVVQSLEEAIGDCELIFGASSRSREISWPKVTPSECAKKLYEHPSKHKTAILFGTESCGLTNEALSLCHYHLYIPANPAYDVLNLSQAVQIICYEIYQFFQKQAISADEIETLNLAAMSDIMGVFEHLEQMLNVVDFIDPKPTRILMLRLKRLLVKSKLEIEEVNILRGIFKAVIDKVTWASNEKLS